MAPVIVYRAHEEAVALAPALCALERAIDSLTRTSAPSADAIVEQFIEAAELASASIDSEAGERDDIEPAFEPWLDFVTSPAAAVDGARFGAARDWYRARLEQVRMSSNTRVARVLMTADAVGGVWS